jgi:hypothetical protein
MNKRPNSGVMIKHDPTILLEQLDLLNRQFNRDLGYTAAGANVNLEFVPAELDRLGRTLAVPGIHEYSFKENDINDLDKEGYLAFLNSKRLNWDYKKYLNIFISPDIKKSNKSFTIEKLNSPPKFTLSDETLPGVTLTKVDTDPGFTDADATGIFLRDVNVERLAAKVITYYGLKTSRLEEDYCDDTYSWNAGESFNKGYFKFTSPDNIRIIPKNIFDGYNPKVTITSHQAERIRYILENCPSRGAR